MVSKKNGAWRYIHRRRPLLVERHALDLGLGYAVRSQLRKASEGPFRQLTPDPITQTFDFEAPLGTKRVFRGYRVVSGNEQRL